MTWNTWLAILNGAATLVGGALTQTVTMNDGTKNTLYVAILGTLANAVAHYFSPATPGAGAAPKA